MLYLAIDQHKHQMTINVRNEQGDVIQKGQISTNHADIDDFFVALVKKARKHRGYMAIVEVCSFNDWLLEKLKKTRCSEIVVIQPGKTAVHKTDKRDANALGELLWNNRNRLRGEQRPNGIRRIFPADPADAQVRQLANFRQHLIKQRTRGINKIKGIIDKHNLAQSAPTQDCNTKKYRQTEDGKIISAREVNGLTFANTLSIEEEKIAPTVYDTAKEKTGFVVILEGYEDAQKVAVIKVVKAATGSGLAESKVLVETKPCIIKTVL